MCTKMSTKNIHKKCQQKIFIKNVHKNVHKKCPQKMSTKKILGTSFTKKFLKNIKSKTSSSKSIFRQKYSLYICSPFKAPIPKWRILHFRNNKKRVEKVQRRVEKGLTKREYKESSLFNLTGLTAYLDKNLDIYQKMSKPRNWSLYKIQIGTVKIQNRKGDFRNFAFFRLCGFHFFLFDLSYFFSNFHHFCKIFNLHILEAFSLKKSYFWRIFYKKSFLRLFKCKKNRTECKEMSQKKKKFRQKKRNFTKKVNFIKRNSQNKIAQDIK